MENFDKSYQSLTSPKFNNETTDLETFLRSTNMLNEEEILFLKEKMEIKTFKKGTILLREGQVSKVSYQNLKGCVREYFLMDGEERTTEFYTEGMALTSPLSTLTQAPSTHYWECVEDTTLIIYSDKHEREVYQKYPRLESFCRMETEMQLGGFREKMAFFINSTPEQRYLHLLETRPELLDRVPQYQLASYLGVKPESLSRIRGRIRNGAVAI